ncbi:MAG TPA: carbohydrate ABC transporter permease [Anaerolineaceae bacterium]|nr:carbohydrate ABC transporter permease [Anaerolineaceae bacterium]
MTERSTLQGQPDNPQKKRKGLTARRLFLYLIIPLVAFVYIVPAIGVILTSFKLDAEIAQTGLWSIPKRIHFDNYKEIWVDANVRTYMKNSALVTIPATAISIMLGVLMGYVFSKLPFKGSELLFIFVLAGMFFPPQIVLVPLFKFYNSVNLYDTLWPMIITHCGFGLPICTLIMRNFFSSVPMAIREAAIIDGASEFDVLTRIMLPVSLPALAVLATLQFTWIWNDFLYPIIFTQSDEMRTIMVGLITMKGQYRVAYGAQGAMAVVASIPTLLIFIFFQRYFIKGMTMGAVKG